MPRQDEDKPRDHSGHAQGSSKDLDGRRSSGHCKDYDDWKAAGPSNWAPDNTRPRPQRYGNPSRAEGTDPYGEPTKVATTPTRSQHKTTPTHAKGKRNTSVEGSVKSDNTKADLAYHDRERGRGSAHRGPDPRSRRNSGPSLPREHQPRQHHEHNWDSASQSSANHSLSGSKATASTSDRGKNASLCIDRQPHSSEPLRGRRYPFPYEDNGDGGSSSGGEDD